MAEQMYELVITADTNDADYVTSTKEVTMEQIEEIKPILEAMKAFKATGRNYGYNWAVGDVASKGEGPEDIYAGVLTEEQIELFNDLAPYGEYGIHTIESVVYYPVPNKVSLL